MTPIVNYGVTEPISFDGPTERDEQLSVSLEKYLRDSDCYETESGVQLRIDVLSDLSRIFKQWIRQVTAKQPFTSSYADKVEGKLYTFGSYRLGVNGKDADIDVLAVAPKHIDRSEFFSSFADLLSKHEKVTDIIVADTAHVPLINIIYNNVNIDLTFARINLNTVNEDTDLKSYNILKNLNETCAISLNGCRVTDEILTLVPNHSTFRLTLRAIKLWAKLRGIYGFKYGFLPGVAFAMLVARICQLYPNASASTIVRKFFLIYSQWQWPKPIMLKEMVDHRLNFSVWNPAQNSSDKFHLMPIITPAYPQMNSTHSVFTSTRAFMVKEFIHGHNIIENSDDENVWKNLFVFNNFFTDYKHFIAVGITAKKGNVFVSWEARVSSRLRLLACKLEKNNSIEFVIPMPQSFDVKDSSFYFTPDDFTKFDSIDNDDCDNETKNDDDKENSNIISEPEKFQAKQFFIGFTVIKPCTSQINLTMCIEEFNLNLARFKQKLNFPPEDIKTIALKVKYLKKSDLQKYLSHSELEKYSKNKSIEVDKNGSMTKKPKISEFDPNKID